MSDVVVRTDAVETGADDARPTVRDPAESPNRTILVIASIATIIPYYWAVVRDVRNGFYPTMDVAATVVRARDVFSSHPPLIGMWSSGSSWAGGEIHFPGALQLYLLAGPTKLFGNSWGPLLTMATLNVFWVMLAVWLVRRRFGTNAALIALLFVTMFMWSIGSENLIDPRPMEMVTIPFLCFLFIVWVVASGEIDALPALAAVANFLFLDHLVLSLQIPVIGMCAALGVILYIRRTRSSSVDDRGPRNRRLRRRLVQTLVITFVMWLPSLIAEIRSWPGNLSTLVRATGEHRDAVDSWIVGYNVPVRLMTERPFWFRGRLHDPDFAHGLDTLTKSDVIGGIVLLALVGVLTITAYRRRDVPTLALFTVVGVGFVVSVVTVVQSPAVWGFLPYLRSVWGLAAFVWFALAFGAWRLFGSSVRAYLASAAGIGAVVFCILGLSFANYGAATDMGNGPSAETMVDLVVPQLTGRGKVMVSTAPDFLSHRYHSALLLGLNTAGVHYCVDKSAAMQYGDFHDCGDQADVSVMVTSGPAPTGPDTVILAEVSRLTPARQQRLAEAVRISDDWLATHDRIRLTPHGQAFVDSMAMDGDGVREHPFAPADGDLGSLMESKLFRMFLQAQATHIRSPGRQESLFAEPDLPIAEMLTRFDLTDLSDPIVVYEIRGDRRS